jgi:hypothetical protein
MNETSTQTPNVEPTYHILDDRAEDPAAFATEPSSETNIVPDEMIHQWREER